MQDAFGVERTDVSKGIGSLIKPLAMAGAAKGAMGVSRARAGFALGRGGMKIGGGNGVAAKTGNVLGSGARSMIAKPKTSIGLGLGAAGATGYGLGRSNG